MANVGVSVEARIEAVRLLFSERAETSKKVPTWNKHPSLHSTDMVRVCLNV